MFSATKCTLHYHECQENVVCSPLSSGDQFPLGKPLGCRGLSSILRLRLWMTCSLHVIFQSLPLSLLFLRGRSSFGFQVPVLLSSWCLSLGLVFHLSLCTPLHMISVTRCTLHYHGCLGIAMCSLLSLSFQFQPNKPLDCQGFSSNPQFPLWMPYTQIEVCLLQFLSLWFLRDRF